jgi:hypothetical protein
MTDLDHAVATGHVSADTPFRPAAKLTRRCFLSSQPPAERAAKLSPEKGGGSLTALPSSNRWRRYIRLIRRRHLHHGRSDLSRDELFNAGMRRRSTWACPSRAGRAAQRQAMRGCVRQPEVEVAQYRECSFAQFGADLTMQPPTAQTGIA